MGLGFAAQHLKNFNSEFVNAMLADGFVQAPGFVLGARAVDVLVPAHLDASQHSAFSFGSDPDVTFLAHSYLVDHMSPV